MIFDFKMSFSTLSRIFRLTSYRRAYCQYLSSLRRSDRCQSTCTFGADSCFEQNSQTNFCTDGTVTGIGRRNPIYIGHVGFLNLSAPSMLIHQVRHFSSSQCRSKKEEITVNFLNRDGETFTVKAKVGETLLDTVIDNDVDIDGFGACEGTLACSTCHLVFDEDVYESLPEKLDEEEDMLDLAYGLEDTSRLGCQICLTKEMDNMIARVPEGINDARDV